MTAAIQSRMADADPMDYSLAMHAVFHHALGVAVAAGIKPIGIDVCISHLGDLSGRPFRVAIHVNNVPAVDDLADRLGLPDDDAETANYQRQGDTTLGDHDVEVCVFAGRPKDRITLIREWVAANYSDESKRLVAEGAEALPDDQAKFAAADAAGLFDEASA